jgi:serine/threonine protein kinase
VSKDLRLLAGAVFAERYVVDEVIAHGTMGTVYAVTEQGGARRALKIMKPDLLEDPTFVQRFALEAEVAKRIQSPHVVETFASGVDAESKLPWLAMELLQGKTLDVYLQETPIVPRQIALRILEELFGAAAAAHAANIVHRDLKPENVFLIGTADQPFVKILDFGIAKIVKEATHSGTVAGLGTPLWTAPEQSREGQTIRPSADVWALGLITFRLLAGKQYWKTMNDSSSSPFDVAVELVKAPLVLASVRLAELGVVATDARLPPAFDDWFSRCVVREPEQRFPTAADAHAALARMFDAPPPTERDTPVPPTVTDPTLAASFSPAKPARWAGLFVALVAIATLVAAAVAAWLLFRN